MVFATEEKFASIDQIRDLTEQSLDRALLFYELNGITLDARPKIAIVDTGHWGNPCIRHFAKKNMLREQFLQSLFKHTFKLQISDEGIYDLHIAMTKDLLPWEQAVLNSKEDIFFSEKLIPEDLKEINRLMYHETWHLIELKYGVIELTPAIIEGTAKYTETILKKSSRFTAPEQCAEYEEMRYDGAAFIVKKHVRNFKNPFQAMLQIPLREQMQQELLKRSKPCLEKMAIREFERQEEFNEWSMQKGYGSDLPATSQEVIDHFLALGATQFIDDLKGQDLSHLGYFSNFSTMIYKKIKN